MLAVHINRLDWCVKPYQPIEETLISQHRHLLLCGSQLAPDGAGKVFKYDESATHRSLRLHCCVARSENSCC